MPWSCCPPTQAYAKSDRTVWAKNQTSYPVNVDQSTGDILINVRAGVRQKGGKEATDTE